ncbi:MAG: tail fiber domain-containing protein [Acidobacteria bacterium]|nr:tail fiber domain-containing protein [Acidobacteriota bacterium]
MILILLSAVATAAEAQTTAFTYQGKLNDGGLAADGNFDLQFRLTNLAGTQIGATLQFTSVAVSKGVFTVQLDFGANFPGDDRYLEIGVRPAASPNPFTILAPRVPITSTPYAIQSLNAATADNAVRLGGILSTNYVQGTDGRLSDARAPLAGSSNYIQNTSLPQFADFNVSGNGTVGGTLSGGTVSAATQFNLGNFRVLSAAGNSNLFAGISAGQFNSTGFANSFFGSGAGFFNDSGNNNSYFGNNSGAANTAGGNNSFFGNGTGMANTASFNSFFGASAGQANTTGEKNSFFGSGAGLVNVTGIQNSFFGSNAGVLSTADNNSFFGSEAGAATTIGNENSFFGAGAGSTNVDGTYNSYFGFNAGNLATGSYNSFVGWQAGLKTTGNNNTFVGFNSGAANTTGTSNTFLGTASGFHSDTGTQNVFVGSLSGNFTTSGSGNAFLGYSAGSLNDTGSNNTMIGSGTNTGQPDLTFATALGAGAFVSTSDTIVLGRAQETTQIPGKLSVSGLTTVATLGAAGATQLCRNAQNQIATCSSSLRYKTDIAPYRSGLTAVSRLSPILFKWKESGMQDVGFGAEDVAKIDPDLVIYNDKGEVEGVKYDRLSTVLVNAVKEQQTQIETQQKRLDEQQKQLDELKKLVCAANPQAALCQEVKQ